jgi:hypothetical protein
MLAAIRSVCLSADHAVIRGVYVDHGVTLQSAKYVDYDVSRAITRRIASVPSAANLLWITNLPDDPAVIGKYVTDARARGMEIVAGSGRWYAYRDRAGEQFSRIRRLHQDLPETSRPWRWSLGDETKLDALDDLRAIADQCAAAGIPTTMVQVPEYHQQTLDTLQARLPMLAVDVYPVFQPGLGTADNIAWGKATHSAVVTRSRTAGVRPLLMTQGFGGGSDPTFALPTPARTQWQVWSAVAAGSPGAVVFAAGMPSPDGGPTMPTPSLIDWNRQTEQLTPQGTAVAATFTRLKAIEGRLTGAALDTTPAWGSVGLRGDCAAIFRPTTGPRLLLVVSDPDAARVRTIKVTLPGVSAASPLAGSTGATLQAWPWPWSIWLPTTLQIAITPGEAWIGEIR